MSPVENAIVTMIVAKVSPKTISTVCARRRGMLRSPIRTTSGRRKAKSRMIPSTAPTAMPTPIAKLVTLNPKMSVIRSAPPLRSRRPSRFD